LSDQYLATGAFHGLHGRSITYASGIKLARPELDVVVVMGDGGTGIGGAHLLAAARRNIGITVIVFNNFNFGMTGGQHSATTPGGAVTSTTPGGNLERPMDICATVAVNGAGYVFRGTSYDEDLADHIAEAMATPGFALLDVWELCSAYFMRSNRFGKKSIERTLDELGFATGVLERRVVPEFAAALRSGAAAPEGERLVVEPTFASRLDRRTAVVLAGSAGGRVRSSARILGTAAILSGLWAAQSDDYPVTVKTGHSVSALVVGPQPIDFAAANVPDVLVVVSPEGAAKASSAASRMSVDGRLYVLDELADTVRTDAEVRRLRPERCSMRIGGPDLALAAVGAVAADMDLVADDALSEASRIISGRFGDRSAAVLAAGKGLLD
jgi:Pyruvate/2-oxoacid:ferredoxin oxidoreductase gamma subunit